MSQRSKPRTSQVPGSSPFVRRLLTALVTILVGLGVTFITTGMASDVTPAPPTTELTAPPATEPAPSNEVTAPSDEAPAPSTPSVSRPQPTQDEISSMLERVQKSLLQVVITWEKPFDPSAMSEMPTAGPPSMSSMSDKLETTCTGWFASPTRIVTAGHCVDPNEVASYFTQPQTDPMTGERMPGATVDPSTLIRTVLVYQPREIEGAIVSVPTEVRVDNDYMAGAEGDFATMELYGAPPATPLQVASTDPRPGQEVWAIGFPGSNFGESDGIDLEAYFTGGSLVDALIESRIQPSATSGSIGFQQYRNGVGVYELNSDFGGGMSGGPTVNAWGEVLGLNSTMLAFGQNFNIITDTATMRSQLQQIGIAPLSADILPANPEQGTDSGSPAGQFDLDPTGSDNESLAIGLGVVITILAVLVMLLLVVAILIIRGSLVVSRSKQTASPVKETVDRSVSDKSPNDQR